MRKVLILLSCCLAVWLSELFIQASPAAACSCVMPPAPAKALEESKAVFSGTVVEIRETLYGKEVLFAVKHTWKGVTQSQVFVGTSFNEASCGFPFEMGKDYLVYAHGDSEFGSTNGLSTNICQRTSELSQANEDLKAIGEGTVPAVQVDLRQKPYIWYLLAAAVLVIFFVWYRKRGR